MRRIVRAVFPFPEYCTVEEGQLRKLWRNLDVLLADFLRYLYPISLSNKMKGRKSRLIVVKGDDARFYYCVVPNCSQTQPISQLEDKTTQKRLTAFGP